MGFFSWKTIDPNNEQSIQHIYSPNGPTPAVLLIPEEFGGCDIIETAYAGYGIFGTRDAYALLGLWNNSELCIGNDTIDRNVGIEIASSNTKMWELEYPLRIVSLDYYNKTKCTYEDFDDADLFSKQCPYQGFIEDKTTTQASEKPEITPNRRKMTPEGLYIIEADQAFKELKRLESHLRLFDLIDWQKDVKEYYHNLPTELLQTAGLKKNNQDFNAIWDAKISNAIKNTEENQLGQFDLF